MINAVFFNYLTLGRYLAFTGVIDVKMDELPLGPS